MILHEKTYIYIAQILDICFAEGTWTVIRNPLLNSILGVSDLLFLASRGTCLQIIGAN